MITKTLHPSEMYEFKTSWDNYTFRRIYDLQKKKKILVK